MAKPRFKGWISVFRSRKGFLHPATYSLRPLSGDGDPKFIVSRHRASAHRLARDILSANNTPIAIDERLRAWKVQVPDTVHTRPRNHRVRGLRHLAVLGVLGSAALALWALVWFIRVAPGQSDTVARSVDSNVAPLTVSSETDDRSNPSTEPVAPIRLAEACVVEAGSAGARSIGSENDSLVIFGGVSVSVDPSGTSIQRLFFNSGDDCWQVIE
jgi:hypothetical protein